MAASEAPYVSILPFDQGIEHSGGASFAANPSYFDPEHLVRLAVEGGTNAIASTVGVLGAVSRKWAHKLPFILKLNHNELLTYPNGADQIMFTSVQRAAELGAVGVGATIYFGSAESDRQIVEVSRAFEEAHRRGRLLDEAVAIGGRLGAQVGRATAAAGDRVIPMGALLTAVSAGSPPLLGAGEMPSADAATPDIRYWLIQELESGMERRATAGPMVIVLDDLQWADGSTVAAVEALSAHLAELPIAWIVGLRAEEASGELAAALERMTAAGALRIRLAPLDAAAVLEVVADLSGARPDVAMGALAESARGVPFWLVELLIALREAGRIEHVDGHATVREGELPSRIWETTRNRLDRMTTEARELVSVASILGRRFTFASLQRMLDASASRRRRCCSRRAQSSHR
jgi:DeoC/LacD family aldolase